MNYKLHVVCSSKGCIELVMVTKHDDKEYYCDKCAKKLAKEGKKKKSK